MIVLLCNCSLNLFSKDVVDVEAVNQSPVEEHHDSIASDTAKVLIPIVYLKKANIKLNERLHLINIVAEQEYMINDYKIYKHKQDSIINVFQERVVLGNIYNRQLQVDLNKEKNKNLEKHILLCMNIHSLINTPE